MTPAAFRTIRQRHGWSYAQMARLLCTSRYNPARWESGERVITPQVALLVTLLDQVPAARRLAEQLAGPVPTRGRPVGGKEKVS